MKNFGVRECLLWVLLFALVGMLNRLATAQYECAVTAWYATEQYVVANNILMIVLYAMGSVFVFVPLSLVVKWLGALLNKNTVVFLIRVSPKEYRE